jgi:hypothetical protein
MNFSRESNDMKILLRNNKVEIGNKNRSRQ